MKRLVILAVLALVVIPLTFTQAQDLGEFSVNCDTGVSFSNGIEFRVVAMRANFQYRATALGINGFDPVLAALGENGEGLCNDDSEDAEEYAAQLPSTDLIEPSNLNSQVTFGHRSTRGAQDVSLVVGGYGDQRGEFLLILEGMAITDEDSGGDDYSVRITPGMVSSEAPIVVYAIGEDDFDPIIGIIRSDGSVAEDGNGNPIVCDDAGDPDRCNHDGPAMTDSGLLLAGEELIPGPFDAYVVANLAGLALSNNPDQNFLNFRVASYENSEGRYVLIFHVGSTDAASTDKGK